MQAFVPGSRAGFDKVMRSLQSYFEIHRKNDNIATLWEQWDKTFLPQSDNVDDYVARLVS